MRALILHCLHRPDCTVEFFSAIQGLYAGRNFFDVVSPPILVDLQPLGAGVWMYVGAYRRRCGGGQLSVGKVHEQMLQVTGVGATKAKLVNSMLESVSAIGIQGRSAAMLNDIDPKQAHEQVEAVGKTLKTYAQLEATLAQTLSHKPPHWPTRRRAARAPWAACWSCWPLHWAR